MTTHIYGHSDDCVIAEGDVSTQQYAYDTPQVMTIDGVKFEANYGMDGWTFEILFGYAEVIEESEHDFNDYSEAIRID
jgi:hypothetical protein